MIPAMLGRLATLWAFTCSVSWRFIGDGCLAGEGLEPWSCSRFAWAGDTVTATTGAVQLTGGTGLTVDGGSVTATAGTVVLITCKAGTFSYFPGSVTSEPVTVSPGRVLEGSTIPTSMPFPVSVLATWVPDVVVGRGTEACLFLQFSTQFS